MVTNNLESLEKSSQRKHSHVTQLISQTKALEASIENAKATIENAHAKNETLKRKLENANADNANANATIECLQSKLKATISEQHQHQLLCETKHRTIVKQQQQISELQNEFQKMNSRKKQMVLLVRGPRPVVALQILLFRWKMQDW